MEHDGYAWDVKCNMLKKACCFPWQVSKIQQTDHIQQIIWEGNGPHRKSDQADALYGSSCLLTETPWCWLGSYR